MLGNHHIRVLLVISMVLTGQNAIPNEQQDHEGADAGEGQPRVESDADGSGTPNPRLSPDQVENQMAADREANPLYESKLLSPIIDWRDQLGDEHGVHLGLDYSTVALAATDSAGEEVPNDLIDDDLRILNALRFRSIFGIGDDLDLGI